MQVLGQPHYQCFQIVTKGSLPRSKRFSITSSRHTVQVQQLPDHAEFSCDTQQGERQRGDNSPRTGSRDDTEPAKDEFVFIDVIAPLHNFPVRVDVWKSNPPSEKPREV